MQLGAGCAHVSPARGVDNYPEVPIIKNGSCTSLSCHVVPRDKHYKTLVDTMIKAITSNGRITRISIIVRYDIFIQLETTCKQSQETSDGD